jgi:hypothetical protein
MSTKKDFIVVDKYEIKVLDVPVHVYIIHLHDTIYCKEHLTNKKGFFSLIEVFNKKLNVYYNLPNQYKIVSKKIYKNDKHILDKLESIMNVNENYTYCLHEDSLIMVETKTIQNNSYVKRRMSTHNLLCKKNSCAAGEVVFDKDGTRKVMVFNNGSGTYQPTYKNLLYIKKALPYLPLKIVEYNSKINSKYFDKYYKIQNTKNKTTKNKTTKNKTTKNKTRKIK